MYHPLYIAIYLHVSLLYASVVHFEKVFNVFSISAQLRARMTGKRQQRKKVSLQFCKQTLTESYRCDGARPFVK